MSETVKRVLSAIIALPIYVLVIVTDSFHSMPALAASLIISLVCLYEYYQIADKGEGKRPFMMPGMILGAVVNIVMYLYAYGRLYGYSNGFADFDARLVFAVFALALPAVFAIQILRHPIEGAIYSLAVTVFGIVFIVFSFSHILLLKALKDGYHYIIIVNMIVMLNDAGAYFGGINFGRHRANFKVSPNKTWEGYFFGLLTSIVAMMVVSQVYDVLLDKHLFGMIEAAVLGIVLSVVGNIGDLIESAIKRDSVTKDSGHIIPGHGGMWDVFDAMIVAMPLFYYYLVIKGVR